jgi:hypothetical protein
MRHAKRRQTGSVRPAAVPPRVPAQAWSADHPDRWLNNNHSTGHNHDPASVLVATTIVATMFATAATFRGLGAEACEAQQGGECRYRQDLSAHLLGYPSL